MIAVKKCNNSTDPSRPCYGDEVMINQASFNLNFFIMNAFVNSGKL